jgi:hypothetical protein
MNIVNTQTFEMEKTVLRYDAEKSTLLCQSIKGNKLWIKKVYDLDSVTGILEDKKRYYISFASGTGGQFLAVRKDDGTTDWFIPGKSFLHIIYGGFFYLIFADEEDRFFLIKVNSENGKSIWFYEVDRDLEEYVFSDNKIFLRYSSGNSDSISIKSGRSDGPENDVALRRV